LHTGRYGGEGLEVGGDLLVIGELAVGANLEAEDFGRCRNVGRGLLLFLGVDERRETER
jgi:hypothetical protein